MIHLLMSHPGTHAVAHAAPIAVLPMIFRRAIAAARRKPPAPEVQTTASGAGEARFACCAHCLTGSPCDPPDAHPVACSEGCNGADWGDAMPPAHSGDTAPSGFPVLRNRMLSEVRNEWEQGLVPAQASAHADAVHETAARYLPAAPDLAATYRRPVNGRRLPDQPRQAVPFGELNRKFSDGRPTRELLDLVLAGLRRL